MDDGFSWAAVGKDGKGKHWCLVNNSFAYIAPKNARMSKMYWPIVMLKILIVK
jgi:hypothetical protein